MSEPQGLRIAFLTYRGNPFTGGQGVYTRHMARQLTELGHHVEVFSGQPYPILDDDIKLTELPSLDIYRSDDALRTPKMRRKIRSMVDLLEFGMTCTAAFAEPLTFSLRANKHLRERLDEFDLIHDNQCLGYGIDFLRRTGKPVLATIHHPITVDKRVEISHATRFARRLILRRFYSFTRMQIRVAKRLERILTVSTSSQDDIIADMGVDPENLHVVNAGVDTEMFKPLPEVERVPGRLMTTASADVAIKGLAYLLDAMAKLRVDHPDIHLVVIGSAKKDSVSRRRIAKLGLTDRVEFMSGLTEQRIAELYNEAQVAVVPSIYEGFSLPAAEAMSCGTPLVATTGGALPEVTGPDRQSGLVVPPGDAAAIEVALREMLDNPQLRTELGAAARKRVTERFTWRIAAERTAEHYQALLANADH